MAYFATSTSTLTPDCSGHLRSTDVHQPPDVPMAPAMSTTILAVSQPSHSRASGRQLQTPPASNLPISTSKASDLETPKEQTPSAFGKQAAQSITPFLTKHIPSQYAPLGAPGQSDSSNENSNTKYCYRHRPDQKCRRQANEPSMDQLQKELATLPQSDQQGITHVWSLFSAAPSKHRNLMLQGILAQCCFPQLSAISASVRDLIKIDFLSALPAELGLKVLCYLDPTSICKAAQVSERWRTLADDDVVWHRMCEQHIDRKCVKCGWGLPLLDRKRLRTEKRQIQLRAEGKHLEEEEEDHDTTEEGMNSEGAETAPSSVTDPGEIIATRKRSIDQISPSPELAKRVCTGPKMGSPELRDHDNAYFQKRVQPWKNVYRDRFRIGTNWKYGRCSIRTFKGHTNGVMCLQFDDTILASGSYDATVKIWDVESGKELRTLSGHTSGVRCLQFDDHKLLSGSLDNTIKMWDLNTGKLVRTLTGHTGGVIALHFEGSTIASGSQDHTVNVWDFKSCSRFVLRGHTDWVNAVKLDLASRTLFSASDDCTIRLWDLDTKQCIKIFEGHVGQVQQVLPLPAEFDILDLDEGAANNGNSFKAADFFKCRDPNRAAPPRYMLSGALDTTIRLWDVHTGRCLRTFFGHLEGIWALAADTLRVVSGANDRMVKIWDPRTGTCERTFTGHSGPVTCVGLSDRRMCTGSEDHEIRLYTF